ncbi:hypothetical protein L1987_14076 [Smallanthus sonchifolius]|uniref:Uncharacterized protein n=1 Tax=Smallanthus sonchifolius TaxID=185202 RepID=A0ACB9J3W8_9ASTR|nr:hypothetical protein L1987_14076 [Smallanthus sonchifolius]
MTVVSTLRSSAMGLRTIAVMVGFIFSADAIAVAASMNVATDVNAVNQPRFPQPPLRLLPTLSPDYTPAQLMLGEKIKYDAVFYSV